MKQFFADFEVLSCAPEFANDMYDELLEGFYKTACRVRDTAKNLVHVKTGALRNTIRARKGKKHAGLEKFMQFITSSGGYFKDDPAAFTIAGDRTAILGKEVYWHYMLEYGTYDKPAHPFFRPAINSNFNAALAEAQHAGQRAINKRRRLRRIAKGRIE